VEPEPATDPGRRPRRTRLGLLLGAAVLALLTGAAGGALTFQLLLRPPALARVLIRSDRPAEVAVGDLVLGPTPVAAVFPVGRHLLQFREAGRPPRTFEVEVAPRVENTFSVELDTLSGPP
jgi:hypothetical protein